MKARRFLLAGIVGIALIWGGYRVYLAHANLVTLSVQNMDVRKVVLKLEWQTWERIVVNKNVGGKVTLNVHMVPLDEVLNIIDLQIGAQWTRLYPLYSSRKSLASFNQIVRGEQAPAGSGWQKLQQLPAWQQASMGAFGNALRAQNQLVSAELVNKDLPFTALALSRFSKAQLVPEDGTRGYVNLKMRQVPFDKVVAKIAKQVRRKWDEIYAIEPLRASAMVVRQKNGSQPAGTNVVVTKPVAAVPQEEPLPPEQALEAIMTTMTPEERAQLQEQLTLLNQTGPGTPVERQQQFQAAASQAAQAAQADLEDRIQYRLKNDTVDHRLAHDRSVLQKQQNDQKR